MQNRFPPLAAPASTIAVATDRRTLTRLLPFASLPMGEILLICLMVLVLASV